MKIAVYLGAVPAKTKNQAKRDLLRAFVVGARSAGDDVVESDDLQTVIDADIAVLQGWIGMKSAPHLNLRQRVIEHQQRQGKHTLVIDSNLFGFLDLNDRDRYLRYSLDGIFPTTGYYFDRDIDRSRWLEICKSYDFKERDWRCHGKYILICLQRQGGWSMDGFDVIDWLAQMLEKIRSVSARPIMVRPHPGSMKVLPEILRRWPQIAISDSADIRHDLDHAWCTVTYNSSPGVASLLWGVPAFVTDENYQRSQAWPEANTDLARIDDPVLNDRQKLYYRLAQCHFATADLQSGRPWRFMRDRLPTS